VLSKNVTTDLSNKKIYSYMQDVLWMGTTKLHTLQIPVEGYYSGQTISGVGSCLVIDKPAQSAAVNQFIFKFNGKGEFKYTPSSTASSTATPAY
jgi:hypothetical protein